MKKFKLGLLIILFQVLGISANAQYVTNIDRIHIDHFFNGSSILGHLDLSLTEVDKIDSLVIKYGSDSLDSERSAYTLWHLNNNEKDALFHNGDTFDIVNNKVSLTFPIDGNLIFSSGFLQVASSFLAPPISGTVINGFVRNQRLNGIQNNVVSLFRYNESTYELAYSSPSDSNFSVLATSPGKYLIQAIPDTSAPGTKNYLPTYYKEVTSWENATQIEVSPTKQTDIIYFNILEAPTPTNTTWNTGQSTITGTLNLGTTNNLRTSANRPALQAIVYLQDANGTNLGYTVTDKGGNYKFKNIATGNYKIKIDYPGYQVYNTAVQTNGSAGTFQVNASLTPLVISAVAKAEDHQTFRIYETENDNFRLILDAPQTVKNVRIIGLTGYENKQIKFRQSDRDLEFSAISLPSGIYMIQLESEEQSSTGKFYKR